MLSGHDQEAGFTGQRLCRSIGISVLPHMVARHAVAHKVNPRKLPHGVAGILGSGMGTYKSEWSIGVFPRESDAGMHTQTSFLFQFLSIHAPGRGGQILSDIQLQEDGTVVAALHTGQNLRPPDFAEIGRAHV